MHVLSHFGHVRLFVTPRTTTHKAPLSMGFSRQESWSGLPFLLPDLLNTGIEPMSPESPASAGGFFTTSTIWGVSRSPHEHPNLMMFYPLEYMVAQCNEHSWPSISAASSIFHQWLVIECKTSGCRGSIVLLLLKLNVMFSPIQPISYISI